MLRHERLWACLDGGRGPTYKRAAGRPAPRWDSSRMNFLKAIFTWWTGATIGATLQIKKGGVFVGEDEAGNRYFETRDKRWDYDGRNRRFVIYNGYADP